MFLNAERNNLFWMNTISVYLLFVFTGSKRIDSFEQITGITFKILLQKLLVWVMIPLCKLYI